MSAPPSTPLTLLPDLTFPEILSAIYSARFTGSLTLHFQHGVPQLVEHPQPAIRIPIRLTATLRPAHTVA